MKKLLYIFSISFLVLITAACGKNEVDESGPADIPIKWVNAQIQNDQSKMVELLDKKTTALDQNQNAERKDTIKKYTLTEWKATNENYFYKIEFQDPTDKEKLRTDKMEVIKTESGWKRTKYGNIVDFDRLVEDLKPKVLRELHDE
ncbi:hypothetical protein I6J18_00295 (plasmid) [Peribacillus psychrosaccharolyticus]|uniref:Lipoprotein n=1 Tax=Peribacillus psychrosaccharolyticus TaxID=1407 RepID=A0A974NIB7_PERPY|nr:hypothetical protein [Peribacillus psychrosaccharolyticus]MEC2054215.1 hypothetical protein [Peribacillus psychrosaccharolyticus]MED3746566.1 hypothetical protein [Peribacillus psychrosaccharolyticus]QQS98426.1 hypothetical protein I6J18_00295 [Peribacillus psychrosaccharolyticus]